MQSRHWRRSHTNPLIHSPLLPAASYAALDREHGIAFRHFAELGCGGQRRFGRLAFAAVRRWLCRLQLLLRPARVRIRRRPPSHAASVCGRPATRTHDFVVWLGAVHHLRSLSKRGSWLDAQSVQTLVDWHRLCDGLHRQLRQSMQSGDLGASFSPPHASGSLDIFSPARPRAVEFRDGAWSPRKHRRVERQADALAVRG
mmetsp:Transcript_30953/g.69902  ORF Transcript_30953/g.69902 Transcript_30953/m.69902 type:complete len:200 (+) Transcript_30953:439-1038(+)